MFKSKFEIITLNKKNITNFAYERNELLKNTKAEWIFFVDSDEKIPLELLDEVKNITDSDSKFNAFYVKRKNYLLGKYVGTDKIIRLGRKNSGKWIRMVHETWDVKPNKPGVLKNYLIHNTADNLYEYVDKINYYSTLHAEENFKEGKKSNLFKIIFFPLLKFIQSLIMGRGTVMSIMQGFHSFLAWSKEYFYE